MVSVLAEDSLSLLLLSVERSEGAAGLSETHGRSPPAKFAVVGQHFSVEPGDGNSISANSSSEGN